MENEKTKGLSTVRREHAENYILSFQISFAVTVILTRLFLELTRYPQIGNGVLHIAHALWGGFLLIIAVMLPLVYANRWALQLGALLGGVGIGLFIDEIGKFITQANDYFYPAALPLIYGFILLGALIYIYFRQPLREDPRQTMYNALGGLQDAIDGNLDTAEAARIETQVAIAMKSDRKEIQNLATAIQAYLQQERGHLTVAKPNYWKRITLQIDALGQRIGRRTNRNLISGLLVLWVALVIGYIAVLVQGNPTIDIQVLQWRNVLIGIQVVIGIMIVIALLVWFAGKEERGLHFAVGGFLLSLVALQTLYFYISQFSAITATLLQLAFLQILFAYRRWYLGD